MKRNIEYLETIISLEAQKSRLNELLHRIFHAQAELSRFSFDNNLSLLIEKRDSEISKYKYLNDNIKKPPAPKIEKTNSENKKISVFLCCINFLLIIIYLYIKKIYILFIIFILIIILVIQHIKHTHNNNLIESRNIKQQKLYDLRKYLCDKENKINDENIQEIYDKYENMSSFLEDGFSICNILKQDIDLLDIKILEQRIKQINYKLNELYEKYNIYTKYRNIKSICTIYEYIRSGRSKSLVSSYNLLEQEKNEYKYFYFEICSKVDESLIDFDKSISKIINFIKNLKKCNYFEDQLSLINEIKVYYENNYQIDYQKIRNIIENEENPLKKNKK